MNNNGIEFEYDEEKNLANMRKHGMDFKTATALWEDTNLLEIPTAFEDEERSLVVGLIDGQCWTAVITRRNETVRIISVRRSRDAEQQIYEG